MRRLPAVVLLILLIASAVSNLAYAQGRTEAETIDPYVGTWLIESINGDPVPPSSTGLREILVLNGTHFFYGRIDETSNTINQITKGGTYLVEDGMFTEIIEFAGNKKAVGKSYSFKISIKDQKLIKSGHLLSRRLDQVWTRYQLEGVTSHSPATSSRTESGWKNIPVKGLTEWSNPDQWWSEENGVVIAESSGGNNLPKWHYLIWNGSLADDFELQLAYRIITDSPQDAGVNFRVDRTKGVNGKGNLIGYQAELDTANLYSKDKWIRKGKLFGNIHDGKRSRMFTRGNSVVIDASGSEQLSPLPQKFVPAKVFLSPPNWNKCLVRVEGDHIQLYLNDQLANEIHDHDRQNKSTGDAIALQFRPSDNYRFEVQNLKYRPLN